MYNLSILNENEYFNKNESNNEPFAAQNNFENNYIVNNNFENDNIENKNVNDNIENINIEKNSSILINIAINEVDYFFEYLKTMSPNEASLLLANEFCKKNGLLMMQEFRGWNDEEMEEKKNELEEELKIECLTPLSKTLFEKIIASN
jgi:hypothetical protein